ncbi:MAG: ACP S-malonyltransferase [Candidatus Eisenbacteria bacterium]|nr:ACP S-malonyltransferase [Candidatus Eisenbacteria bacterium]
MKLAFLFPGQGAQAVGMGKALADANTLARDTFATADRVLGFGLTELCWNGPAEDLKKSKNTQPALLTHSVAAWRLVEAAGVTPDFVAGHSLGEYSACVAAGALAFEDALTLTRTRGELMYEAGLARPGAMAAVLGLSAADVEAACAEAASAGIVRAANLNAPGQVVISGEPAAVDLACEKAKARGAKRAIKLEVSGAFHSPLMEPAAAGLKDALAKVTIRDARCPIVSNAWARPVQKAAEIRSALEEQLLASVRWEESMRLLRSEGVEGFVELGTGKVLRGLLRTIDSTATSWNVEDPDSLTATKAALEAAGRTA